MSVSDQTSSKDDPQDAAKPLQEDFEYVPLFSDSPPSGGVQEKKEDEADSLFVDLGDLDLDDEYTSSDDSSLNEALDLVPVDQGVSPTGQPYDAAALRVRVFNIKGEEMKQLRTQPPPSQKKKDSKAKAMKQPKASPSKSKKVKYYGHYPQEMSLRAQALQGLIDKMRAEYEAKAAEKAKGSYPVVTYEDITKALQTQEPDQPGKPSTSYDVDEVSPQKEHVAEFMPEEGNVSDEGPPPLVHFPFFSDSEDPKPSEEEGACAGDPTPLGV